MTVCLKCRQEENPKSEALDPIQDVYRAVHSVSERVKKQLTTSYVWVGLLKVHKIENFYDSDFGICDISLLIMSKY